MEQFYVVTNPAAVDPMPERVVPPVPLVIDNQAIDELLEEVDDEQFDVREGHILYERLRTRPLCGENPGDIQVRFARGPVGNDQAVLFRDYSYWAAYDAYRGDMPVALNQDITYETPQPMPQILYGVSAIDSELFATLRLYVAEANRPAELENNVYVHPSASLTNLDLYRITTRLGIEQPQAQWTPRNIASTFPIQAPVDLLGVNGGWPAAKSYVYCTFNRVPFILVKSRYQNVYWGFDTNFTLIFAVRVTIQPPAEEGQAPQRTELYQIKGRSRSRIVEELFRRDTNVATNLWCRVYGRQPIKREILAFTQDYLGNIPEVIRAFRAAAVRGAGQAPAVPVVREINNEIPDQFRERYNRVIMNLLPIREPANDIVLANDGGYAENRVFRYLQPSRFAVVPDPERGEQINPVEQLSFLGGQATFPTFTPNNIDENVQNQIDDLMVKVRQCPVNIGDCLFGHQYSTPFAPAGSTYSKFRHIPFCTQHLLSVFGIGLEYDKDVTMTPTCTFREDTYGPYAVAEGLSEYKDFVFRRRQCIYPRFAPPAAPPEGGAPPYYGNVMAALSILFASTETLPYLGLSRNLTNFMFWVLESNTTKVGNICQPWDLINVMKCDRPAMDALATIVAFVLWGQTDGEARLDTMFPYMNGVDFCTDVAKKLHHLNLLTADCRRVHGINCYNYFILKLLEYNTDARVLYNAPNVDVNGMTGITAFADICRGENLTTIITNNVIQEAYRMFKEYNAGANIYSGGRKPMFLKPPTGALTLKSPHRGETRDNVIEMEFRKSSLAQVADSCNGFYNSRLEYREPVELRLADAQRAIAQYNETFVNNAAQEGIQNQAVPLAAEAAGLARIAQGNDDYQMFRRRMEEALADRNREPRRNPFRIFPEVAGQPQQPVLQANGAGVI